MSPNQIKHFLLLLDVQRGEAEVRELGTDRDSAIAAYEAAEAEHRGDAKWDIVMVGSDSIETVRRTHASYFDRSSEDLRSEVQRELAALDGRRG
jgi:hypothetical protein